MALRLRRIIGWVVKLTLVVVVLVAGALAIWVGEMMYLSWRIPDLFVAGRYELARQLAERNVELIDQKIGREGDLYAIGLNQLAAINLKLGRYSTAAPLFERCLAIYEKSRGLEHPDLAKVLSEFAELNKLRGNYANAERLFIRSLAIVEKAHGPRHVDVSLVLNNLATLYHSVGRYDEAESRFSRALSIREQELGRAHIDVAATLNNLGVLYLDQGRFVEAERLLRRSFDIREDKLVAGHPDVGETLHNLAALYRSTGRDRESVSLLKRALTITEKALGPLHPDVGVSLVSLAKSYKDQGQYSEAELLVDRALKIYSKKLDSDHPNAGAALDLLAKLSEARGRYPKAESLYKRALAIAEKAFGVDDPSVGTGLNNLAVFYLEQGDFEKSSELFGRALTIAKQKLGPDHPISGIAYANVAALDIHRKNWQAALKHYRLSTSIYRSRGKILQEALGNQQTSKNENYSSRPKFVGHTKAAFAVANLMPSDRATLSNEAFQQAQLASDTKAAVALALMSARHAKNNKALEMLVRKRQDLIGEWKIRDQLRVARFSQPRSRRDRKSEAENSARIASIEDGIANIDKRLKVDFPEYAALSNPVPLTIAQTQEHLRPDQALVLFLDTADFAPTPEETFVWVVTKTQSRWVRSNLGTKALRDHVDALRCGLDFEGAWTGSRCFDLLSVVYTDDDRKADKPLPFGLSWAHELYKSLFGQVEDLIKDKHLLIVPSGPLTQLPFQVLVTEKPQQEQLTRTAFRKASWLAKHHAITVLPSVSSLKALRAHAKTSTAKRPFVGFGNPLLDGDKGNRWHRDAAKQARSIKGCAAATKLVRTAQLRVARQAVMPMGRGARLADLAQLRSAAALPETADEVCDVGRAAGAGNDDIYLGVRATEAGLKALSEQGVLARYKVVHFATHGALAGELTGSNEPGLILSPPATATANDDGYLSASEVAGLKLDADWVILSACNTAGSGANNAEALSGLAKAFFYAGARSLLVSHWYVDSQATVALITKAFDELKRNPKVGRAGALRAAMLSLLKTGKRTWHPAYWAPFIVVGEGA